MTKKSQIQKFRDAARAAGAHDSEKRFDAALKAVARPLKHAQKDAPKDGGQKPQDKREG